jgi:NADPH-dependent 2,4-dienoyl-CoA reductase/sulfur reductase-like enzyme
MRVELPGISRSGPGFRIRFAGKEVTAFPGESIAAALAAAGVLATRSTASGEPRGAFCGMGVCGECLVMVDGTPQRACMTAASPGLEVAPAPPRASPQPAAASRAAALACDLLVIGAGPAGLAAAAAARAAGLDVLLIDERSQPGGQYFKQPGKGLAVDAARIDAQFAEGRALVAQVLAAGVRLLGGMQAWSAGLADGGIEVAASGAQGPATIRARRLVIATGAMERPWPVPGWTLPGVMTTGAGQTLLRAGLVAPGARVLVAGNGPLNLQLADELVRAGVTVVAVAEQARRPGPGHLAAMADMLASAPALVAAGAAQLARLARAGVPVRNGHVVTRVDGADRVERVMIAPVGRDGRPGAGQWFAVDALCIGVGFQPQAEIARLLGCAMAWQGDGPVVVRDDDGRTSLASVFVAGDGGGLGGARAALAQGWLAGVAAAQDLTGSLPAALQAGRRQQRAALARARRFQRGLWTLFSPAALAEPVTTADTILCRCEGVTCDAVDGLIAQGGSDPGSIKRATRLGMGRCQGRYCAPLLAARLAAAAGRAPTPDDLFAPRPPGKPVTLAEIAAAAP